MKTIFTLICILLSSPVAFGQYIIQSSDEYDQQIGNLISMMDDLKGRVTDIVKDLDQDEVDFLLDDQANRIGALIAHLAATERYYQIVTFEDREFDDNDRSIWGTALSLGDAAREELVGQSIQYYLDQWEEVRQETKKSFLGKSDEWLNEERQGNDYSYNLHWSWYHVMEHQSNHMGQIVLVKKRAQNN